MAAPMSEEQRLRLKVRTVYMLAYIGVGVACFALSLIFGCE